MKVTYVGPHLGVQFVGDAGQDILVERGGQVEVSDELGHRLLEQPSNWQAVRTTKTKSTTEPVDDPKE